MKIVFLGTGTSTGVPMIGCKCKVCHSTDERDKRLRCAVYLELNDVRICFDSGPDFRQQMLYLGIDRLDAIVFTHEHKDHVAGLDDVRAFSAWSKSAFEVYAEKRMHPALFNEYAYIFNETVRYPGAPVINLHAIEHPQPFDIKGLELLPIRVIHGKLPILGFRVKNFTYITDASSISLEEKEKIKGSQVLVINALRHEPHWSHFSIAQAVALANELQIPQTYFTHISHSAGFHADLEQSLPSYIKPAYDGLTLTL